MAKKKLKVTFDSPVVIICAGLTILLYMLDKWALKSFITQNILTCLGSSNGNHFDPLSLVTYLRILLHCFGATDWSSLLINTSFFLLLGPLMEERYGSPILMLMMAASVLVSGVFACFSPIPMTGSYCIVFMLILLIAVFMLSKKQIPVSWILIFLIYLVWTLVNGYENNKQPEVGAFFNFFKGNIPTFIDLLAGVCGSLFGFLVVPRTTRSRKTAEDKDSKDSRSSKDSSDTSFSATYSDSRQKNGGRTSSRKEDSKKSDRKNAVERKFEYIDLSGVRDDDDMISVSDIEREKQRESQRDSQNEDESEQKSKSRRWGRKNAGDSEETEVIGTIKF